MIRYTNTISVDDYNRLRDAVGWRLIAPAQAKAGLDNSASYIIAAVDGEQTVGMARLIMDGGHSAFIEDVIVLPEFQRQGIGTYMMERIMSHLRSMLQEGYWFSVVLIAAQGKEPFYEKFGFIARPNATYGAGMSQHIG